MSIVKRLVVRWLRAWLFRLDPPPPPQVPRFDPFSDPPRRDPMADRGTAASRLVAWADARFPETSGEHKRHQVYAVLIKQYPNDRKRDLGLAIELALQ